MIDDLGFVMDTKYELYEITKYSAQGGCAWWAQKIIKMVMCLSVCVFR